MFTKYPYIEFSGGLQQITTPHIRKVNEVAKAINANFTKVLGAFVRRDGAQKYDAANYPTIPTSPIAKPALGAFVAPFPTGAELWMASNITADASASVRRWDGISSWVDVQTGLAAGSEINFWYDNDEVWLSSYSPGTDTVNTPYTVDSSHSVSAIRQLQFAPAARFYMEFNGYMYAANCLANGVRYRDRLYQSSGLTGAVAFSRSAQTDSLASFDLVDQVPTMTGASTPAGAVAASSTFTGYNAWWAFNGNLLRNTGTWFSGPTNPSPPPAQISYDFGLGNPKVITHYALTPVPSDAIIGGTTDDPKSAPKTWTFEGSNDNSTWTVIDTQTNAAAWGVVERRVYTTANTTSYRYYRINVSATFGGASAQNLVMISEIEFLNSTSNVSLLQLNVDSSRYLKPGMPLEVYKAGTNTKTYTLTVNSVDKINDAITFLPYSQVFLPAAVNTGTDVITVADASQLVTGTPIIFITSGTLPAGLSLNTTYYAINVSSTTFKVAASTLNATLGVAVDITGTGTGNHTVKLSYIIGNKDELWAAGRHGLLTRFWNTDYRDPTTADWLKLPATLDALNNITAVGKIASRFFIWTANAMFKYDGSNLTPLANDIGCIAMKTVCYYMGFMVWLDAKGQIWSRNEAAGTQDVISTPIQKTIARIPMASLTGATAVCVGRKYKLTLGQVTYPDNTIKTLRVVYDFDANHWTTEEFNPQMLVQLEYKYQGNIQPHFFDEVGNFWVDELGNDDAGIPIVMDVEIGPDTLQIMSMRAMSQLEVDEVKNINGLKVYGKNCIGTKVLISIDNGDFIEVGDMKMDIDTLAMPKELPRGTMINIRFISSTSIDAAEIHRVVVYFNNEEDTFRVSKR